MIACVTAASLLYKHARMLNAIKRLDITKPGPGFTVSLSQGGDRSPRNQRSVFVTNCSHSNALARALSGSLTVRRLHEDSFLIASRTA